MITIIKNKIKNNQQLISNHIPSALEPASVKEPAPSFPEAALADWPWSAALDGVDEDEDEAEEAGRAGPAVGVGMYRASVPITSSPSAVGE